MTRKIASTKKKEPPASVDLHKPTNLMEKPSAFISLALLLSPLSVHSVSLSLSLTQSLLSLFQNPMWYINDKYDALFIAMCPLVIYSSLEYEQKKLFNIDFSYKPPCTTYTYTYTNGHLTHLHGFHQRATTNINF